MLQAIPLLAGGKFKKLIKFLISKRNIRDSSKFALFVAIFNLMYKAILCLCRRIALKFKYENVDRISAPIAGLCAGLTLKIDSRFRREFVSVLALSRFIETGLNLAESNKTIPKVANREFYLWMFGNLIT